MPEPDLLTAALDYAARGWAVFPCQPRAKRPATPHGLRDATTDAAQIRRWWGAMPRANIGLACGPSGLVVIDLDGAAGLAAWERLAHEHGIAGATAAVLTGKGRHLYFAAPEGARIGSSAGRLAPGVDVRARGGYVIAPPSVHPSGARYAWDPARRPDRCAPIPAPAPLPAALRALLAPSFDSAPSGRSAQDAFDSGLQKPQPSAQDAAARQDDFAAQGHPERRVGAVGRPAVEGPCASFALRDLRDPSRLRVPDVRSAPEGRRNDTLNRAAFALGQRIAAGELDRAAVERELLDAARAAGLPDRETRATLASGLDAGIRTHHAARTTHHAIPIPDDSQSPPASPWLDAYIAFSRKWSPRAYDDFHEAAALWLLSTIAARRVTAHLGGQRYTNLYIALTARTSLYAKSTTARIALETLGAAGLSGLLAPDDATPQAFLAALSARLPDDYAALGERAQAKIRERLAFAGQRGWYYDEFGSKVSALMRENGFMADFRGLLRRLDDCPEQYEYVTVGRGVVQTERPYLALLANMTPADLRPFARRGAALWQDGFWARFAFVAPAEGTPLAEGRFPQGAREIPPELTAPLVAWHRRLGAPDVEVRPREGADGKPAGGYDVTVYPPAAEECTLGREVVEAFYAYNDALLQAAAEQGAADLDGPYARLAEKALRVALLLGSLENSGLVELRHWARGQAAAERWRAGLHAVYDQMHAEGPDPRRDLEERLLALVHRLGSLTAARARCWFRTMSTAELNQALADLAAAGALASEVKHGTTRYLPASDGG